MFTQLFIFFIGLSSIILGLKDGDYLWVLCGLMMLISPIFSFYQSKTDKLFFNK